jgi:heme A synthase
MTKLQTVLLSAVPSIFVSVIAGFAHSDRILIQGIRITYGLFLAVSICVLTILWLNRQFRTRLAGTVFLVIWVLVTLRMAIESTNGDLVFTVTWYSTSYIIAGAILLSMTAVLPVMRLPQEVQQVLPESQA